jgi:hypothetical protein
MVRGTINLPIVQAIAIRSEAFISTLKMKTVFYSEPSLFIYQNRRHHKPGFQTDVLHSFGANIAGFVLLQVILI